MDSSTILWIVGEPGVGKTTIARQLLESYGPRGQEYVTPKWTRFGNVAAAGWWRGGSFDGTDTLPISHIKLALPFYLNCIPCDLAVLDGDKLANQGVVNVATEAGCRIICFHLTGPSLAIQRRIARGTVQRQSWVDGRRTKAQSFYNKFPATRFEVEVTPDTAPIVKLMREVCRAA
jgi:GTPase SAR1 family protein